MTKSTRIHTPGPWEHGDNGLIYGQAGEDDVEAPFICDVIEDSAMQALGILSPAEEANARRIVAAVNACEGISTEALKRGVVVELLEACNYVQPHLEEYVRWHHKHQGGCSVEMEQALDLINAALTKATGKAV